VLHTPSLDIPVFDRTNRNGFYDLELDLSSVAAAGNMSREAVMCAIMTAYLDQLGLKVERRTESLKTVIVDHVEQPAVH
jgi:uncharacterized protein (TIGR03435 family)